MRYLVTGGAGFVGSHLVEALSKDGHQVTVLDNLSTGRESNLSTLPPGQVRFVQGSVLDPLLVDTLVSQCDVVIHLAAAVGVRLVVKRPLHSFNTNIKGSEIVLEAAHRYRRKVLVASTSEIYGKNEQSPFREDGDRIIGNPKVARWWYSTSKAVDEILAFGYHREKGLPTVVARLFNTVGPRQTGAYGMVLPTFASQAISGAPLTVFGDGKQSRCFCHVKDVVRAIIGLLNDPRAEGDAFNVGSNEEITVLELAERVIDTTASKSEIHLIPYEQAYGAGFEDMQRRVPDTAKINSLIDWKPEKRLDEIIADVVEFLSEGDPSTVRG